MSDANKPSISTISYKTNSSTNQIDPIIPTKEFAVGIPLHFEEQDEVFIYPPQLQNQNNIFLNEIMDINGDTVPPLYFIAAQSNGFKNLKYFFLFFVYFT